MIETPGSERRLVKLDSIRVDLAAQTEGQWQPTPWPGVRLRVRAIDYEPYVSERNRERERLGAHYVNAPVPDSVWNPILGRLLSEHILLSWDGFDPPYDPDVARDVLRAEDGKPMRDAVILAAAKVGVRELEFVVQLEKNSAPPSGIN